MGVTFLIMDNFSDASEAGTMADALDQRKFPYIYEKMPFEVYKWKCNNWGKLEWITFYERTELIPDPLHNGKYIQRQYYRRWDKQQWTIYWENHNPAKYNEYDEVVDKQAPHGLTYLPVYPILDYVKNNNLTKFPTPLLADLANMAFVLYNLESWILLLDVYCFPVLTLPPMDGSQIALSAANAIEVPNEAKHAPSFISPPTSCLEVLLKCADRLEDKIYKAANQLGVTGNKPSQQTGVSKQWDFRGSNSLLMKTAYASKKTEEWMAQCFADYTHTSNNYEVDYPTEFVEQYSQQRIESAAALLKEMPPENLAKELWKEIAKVYFDDDPKRAKDICDQIDAKYTQGLNDAMHANEASVKAGMIPPDGSASETDSGDGNTPPVKQGQGAAAEDDFMNTMQEVLKQFGKVA